MLKSNLFVFDSGIYFRFCYIVCYCVLGHQSTAMYFEH